MYHSFDLKSLTSYTSPLRFTTAVRALEASTTTQQKTPNDEIATRWRHEDVPFFQRGVTTTVRKSSGMWDEPSKISQGGKKDVEVMVWWCRSDERGGCRRAPLPSPRKKYLDKGKGMEYGWIRKWESNLAQHTSEMFAFEFMSHITPKMNDPMPGGKKKYIFWYVSARSFLSPPPLLPKKSIIQRDGCLATREAGAKGAAAGPTTTTTT